MGNSNVSRNSVMRCMRRFSTRSALSGCRAALAPSRRSPTRRVVRRRQGALTSRNRPFRWSDQHLRDQRLLSGVGSGNRTRRGRWDVLAPAAHLRRRWGSLLSCRSRSPACVGDLNALRWPWN